MSGNRIILIDSNNIAYRAFYALPQTIFTSTGQMTNAVYGFTSMLLKILEDKKPDTVICAFDSKGPTFRHEAYDSYKATRKKMPDELIEQMPLIREVADALNIKSLEINGYEADDIIATLAKKLKHRFSEVIVLSSDKDILQLVSENISVVALKKGITDTVIYNEAEVKDKFGVEPAKIKDLLALTGDSSDNIPGVSGIGPKTAVSLINTFGNLDSIYKNISEIKNEKLKNTLVSGQDMARKSLELTELKYDLDIDVEEIIKKKIGDIDNKKAESIFDSLEFSTLKKRLYKISYSYGIRETGFNEAEVYPGSKNSGKPLKKITGKIFLNTIGHLGGGSAKPGKLYVSIFSAPTGEENSKTDSAKSSFQSTDPEEILLVMDTDRNFYFFSIESPENNGAKDNLKNILSNAEAVFSGFDFKRIYKFLKKYDIEMFGSVNDYKIQYLLLNPEKSKVGISDILTDFLDPGVLSGLNIRNAGEFEGSYDDEEIKNEPQSAVLKNSGNSQMDFGFDLEYDEKNKSAEEKIPQSFPASYIEQLIKTKKIKNHHALVQMLYFPDIEEKLAARLEKEGMEKLYAGIEAPLIKVLADMEFKGVNIDTRYLSHLLEEYNDNIDELTNSIYLICGERFNINSTQQLSKILYGKLKLTATKKTKTGYSTDASTLVSMLDMHPVIEKILDYREKVKLKNTYIDVLPELIDPADLRVHTTYNQLGTTTGRISSNNPNLQNIPIRTDLGRQIRKAFIPGSGYDLLLSADYSQIELRILAHLSEDSGLIEAFRSGMDIHTKTAAEIFGFEYASVDENLRRRAKAINFGILYGMTEYGLKSRLSISEDEAREYINLYFSRYPDVKKYMNKMISEAYSRGYTTTMFGRRRYIRELGSSNANIRSLGERLAVNTPIQGSAADIMKFATVVLFEKIRKAALDCNLILHVHDEIVLELKQKDQEKVKIAVAESMEKCVDLKTGLKVDIKTGRNWLI